MASFASSATTQARLDQYNYSMSFSFLTAVAFKVCWKSLKWSFYLTLSSDIGIGVGGLGGVIVLSMWPLVLCNERTKSYAWTKTNSCKHSYKPMFFNLLGKNIIK